MRRIKVKIPHQLAFVYAMVDDEDYEKVGNLGWYLNANGYAYRNPYKAKGVTTDGKVRGLMHRIIIGATPEQVVDHINGKSLDNRRKNIRLCSQAENMMNRKKKMSNNSTGLPGIYRYRRPLKKKWAASLNANGSRIWLGYFLTKREAHAAYRTASLKHHGEFSPYYKN